MPLKSIKLKKYKGIYELYKKTTNKITGYYVSYRGADGIAVKHKVEADSKDEALEKLNQIKAQVKRDKHKLEQGGVIANAKMTINDLASEFFEDKKDNANTSKDISTYNKHIKNGLGKLKASDLMPKHIIRLQSTLSDTLSPKSVNNITDKLRSIMRYGIANIYIPTSSYKLDGYKKLQVDNIAEFVFTPDEVRELITGIEKPRTKLFIAMAYFTAQRPESLLRLQVKNIQDGFLHFSAIKKQKSHKVAIHPELKVLLDEWINDLDNEDYIFYGRLGKHKAIAYTVLQTSVKHLFEPYNERYYLRDGMSRDEIKKAKAEAYKVHRKQWASLYSLRHSSATAILAGTGNIAVAGQVLNHSDPRMTQRYAKILDKQKESAIGVL